MSASEVLVSCSLGYLLLQPDQPFFELLALQNTRVAVEQPTDFGCLAWAEIAVGNSLQEG